MIICPIQNNLILLAATKQTFQYTKDKEMKKKLMTTALVGIALSGMAQQKCQISGHFDGVPSDSLYVMVIDERYSSQERVDTVILHNGDMNYSIECDKMRILYLIPANGSLNNSMSSGYMQVLAVPGESAVMTGSSQEYFFSGSKFYTDYNEYDRLTTAIHEKMNALPAEYKRRTEAKENAEEVQKDIETRYEALQKELRGVAKNFVKTKPEADLSAYLLMSIPADERADYKKLIPAETLSGPMSAYIAFIEKQEAARAAREEAAKKVQPGAVAPDFTLQDINGKPLALSSLLGKTVVLDFWGSWCGWCIKGMPKMKEYYDKYKAKGLEILGIDCRDTEAKWKAAVEKHSLPWLHVRNEGNPDVSTIYAVGGYPTKVVVGPDGKILKVVVGEDPEFYTYLDELFK